MALCIILLFPFLLRRQTVRIDLEFSIIAILVISISFFSLFFARVPGVSLVRLGELAIVLFSYLGIFGLTEDAKAERYIFWGVWTSGLIVAILSILQSLELIPVMFPPFSHYKQVYSVMGNQVLVGGYLAMCALWVLDRYKGLNIDYLWVGLFLIASVLGLFVTRSRSAWISFLIPFFINNGRNIKKFAFGKETLFSLLLVMGGVIVFFPLIYNRMVYSFTSKDVGFWIRFWIYDGTVRMLIDRFPLGVGFGNFYYWSPLYLGISARSNEKFLQHCNEILTLHAHCDILEFLVELGFLGIFVVLIFFFWWFINGRVNLVWICYLILSLFNTMMVSVPHLYLALLSLMKRDESSLIIKVDSSNKRLFIIAYSVLFVFIVIYLTIILWVPDYRLRQAEKKLLLKVDCVEEYEKVVSNVLAPSGVYEGLASAYILRGDIKRAYDLLLESLRYLNSGSIYVLLGRCAYQLGREKDAIRWYREALIRFPKNQEAISFLDKFDNLENSFNF
ncbi:MAG: O-antigen ligase family protein [Candidatus Hydrogenedentes bacterium]|nr:O-antigen ligase family protein [Candidatus Hydrogenedentota bacterium]